MDSALKQEYAGVKLTLENCLIPTELISTTPSGKDGLDAATEEDLRLSGCDCIQIAGIMLRVPQVAMATAQVLFQRFFFAKSFVKNKMEEAAMACIWLASKVEEAPRRIRDVINVFHYLRQRRKSSSPSPLQLDSNYINLKNNVIKLERRLLKELGFCVHVKHPHKIIVVYLQVLGMEKNQDLVQTAWNYMNDSLRSTVFVRYTPETIACACIYLAARVLQVALPNQPHWFFLFNATEEELQQICLSILRVYYHKKSSFEDMEVKVEACRKAIQEEKMKNREAAAAAAAAANNAQSPRPATVTENSPKKTPTVVSHVPSMSSEKRSSSHAKLDDHKRESYSSGKSHRPRSSSIPRNSKRDKLRSRSPSHKHSRHKSRSQAADRQSASDLPKSYRETDEHDSKNSQSRDKARSKGHHHSKRSRSRGWSGASDIKKTRHDRSSDSSSPSHSDEGRSHKSKSYHKKRGKRRK